MATADLGTSSTTDLPPSKPRVTFFGKPHHNYGFPDDAFDARHLPDIDNNLWAPEDIAAFEHALAAPDPITSADDGSTLQSPGLRSASSFGLPEPTSVTNSLPAGSGDAIGSTARQSRHGSHAGYLISAQNDWAPVNQRIPRAGKRRRKRRMALGRSVDEAREGYLYALLRWPFLLLTMTWIMGLGAAYMVTRLYVWGYEYFVAWRGERERLRRNMRATSSYRDWVQAAKALDAYLGNNVWKEENEYVYYDSKTVRRVWDQIRRLRQAAQAQEPHMPDGDCSAGTEDKRPVDELKALIEACVKNNFVGVENARLYSETYYGTKNLVQNFVDEGRERLRGPPGPEKDDGMLTCCSGKMHSLPGHDDADLAGPEADSVQAHARKLRPHGPVPVRRGHLRVLPLRRREGAPGGRSGARSHHGDERRRAGGSAGGHAHQRRAEAPARAGPGPQDQGLLGAAHDVAATVVADRRALRLGRLGQAV